MNTFKFYTIFLSACLFFCISSLAQKNNKAALTLTTADAQGRVAIAIELKDLPGQKFVLEIPEIFTLKNFKGGLYNYNKQVWHYSGTGATMSFADEKYQYNINLKMVKKKNTIGLKWNIGFKNNTLDTLYDLAAFNCFTMNHAPLFKDTTMVRTFVNNAAGKRIILKNVSRIQGEGRRNMQFYPAVGGITSLPQSQWISQWAVIAPQQLSGKKISVISTDSHWLFENIVDGTVAYFFNNWEGDHGCVHASPLLTKLLRPGASAKASGIFKFTKVKK